MREDVAEKRAVRSAEELRGGRRGKRGNEDEDDADGRSRPVQGPGDLEKRTNRPRAIDLGNVEQGEIEVQQAQIDGEHGERQP